MADEFTPNYNFFLPKDLDSMADVKKNITDAFKKIEPRNNITVIAAGAPLPQSGNYELGDRVFRNDPNTSTTYPSNYILICKDANWGWHWRPIQQTLSPWVTITNNVIEPAFAATFEVHATFKFQIALDSRGWCHWRGVVGAKVAGFPSNTALPILKDIPSGIRPNVNFVKPLATSPVAGSAGIAGYTGARIIFENTGHSYFIGANTDTLARYIWLDGIRYNNSSHIYYDG